MYSDRRSVGRRDRLGRDVVNERIRLCYANSPYCDVETEFIGGGQSPRTGVLTRPLQTLTASGHGSPNSKLWMHFGE
ncbi:hypothetical protein CH273_17955 [Rhodococcus sp. 05-339-2]|nr:hypothetical protein CH273_17955 [Rhodococcus sp. 05-339-2]